MRASANEILKVLHATAEKLLAIANLASAVVEFRLVSGKSSDLLD
jgi:hypothetical protein